MREPRPFRELFLAAIVVATCAYSWLFSEVTVPNERTRAYLTIALVDQGTLRVDGPVARFGKVYDLARFERHYYTDKAPGSSFLAVPVYAAARLFRPAEMLGIVDVVNLVRTWLMLPMALVAFCLLRRLLTRLGVSESSRDLASFGFSLGSVTFHYSTAFYGHALVSTLFIALLLVQARAGLLDGRAESSSTRSFLGHCAGAGTLGGLMGLIEFQAVVVAGIMALPILLTPVRRRFWGFVAYGLGALPFAVALLAYNTLAFGGPFELSYHHLVGQSLQDLHGFGLAGATRPTWAAVEGLLFSRHRGLITTSPWMGLGFLGLVWGARRMPRALWLTSAMSVAYFVLIVASSSVWFGGWSFGPRLLVPITPLLAIAAGWFIDAIARAKPQFGAATLGVGRAAALIGIAYHQLVHVTFAELPPSVERPLPDVVWPMLRAELLSPNLGCKVWGPGALNLLPWAALLTCVAAFLLWPRTRRVAELAGSFAALAAVTVAVLGLSLEAPSNSAKGRAKWLSMVEGFSRRETRCASVSE